jgi:hypothetical protein
MKVNTLIVIPGLGEAESPEPMNTVVAGSLRAVQLDTHDACSWIPGSPWGRPGMTEMN